MSPHSPVQLARVALALDACARFGRLQLRALGSSMLPTVLPGDVLTFHALTGPATPQPGQIVLVQRDDRLFVHRLRARTAAGWITRGDSLDMDDPPVADAALLGVLASHLRGDAALAHTRHRRRLRNRLAAQVAARFSPVRKAFLHFPHLARLCS